MPQPDTNLARIKVVSLEVDVCDPKTSLERIDGLVSMGEGGYVCLANVHMVMEAHDDPAFAARVNAADLVIADGMPIVWMQKLQGKKNAARLRGNDLTIMLCRHAAEKGWSVGFYGGKQEVIDAMLARMQNEFPQLKIAYAYSPPFRTITAEEDAQTISNIRASGTQILFVGLGCPKQENWMAEHKDKVDCVMLGIGAVFDFYAGNIKQSPAWLSKLGLEWMFRLTQEPKRLWRRYLILNPRFIYRAAKQLIRQ